MIQNMRLKVVFLSAIELAFYGLSGLILEAAPMGVATIPGLVSSADVIAVGTVSSVQAANSSSAGRLVLSVSEVLKGNYIGPLTLSYEAQSVGTEQAMVGERVLAFCKLNSDGQSYTLLPMSYGPGALLRDQVLDAGIPVSVPALAMSNQDTPLQKVIKELAMIQIGSATSTAVPYLMSLVSARVEPQMTQAAFQEIQIAGPQSGALGAAGLVAMGNLNGLEAADSLDVQNHPELGPIISSIESSYNDTSQTGLQILVRWLGPAMPAVKRQAAAGAMARIHTPAAVVQLGSALNDSDFEVRWRAIGGLSMFANNVPIGGVSPAPGFSPFRTPDTIKFSAFDRTLLENDEDTYLTFWRQWWSQNQKSIQTLAAAQAQ